MKKRLISILLAIMLLISVNTSLVFAGTVTDTDMAKIKDAMDLIFQKYRVDVQNDQLVEGAIKGMLETLDPHSEYFTKDEYAQFMDSLSGEYSGIGAYIQKSGNYIEVTGLIKNSPAANAGMIVGDKILSIDGQSAVGMEPDVFAAKARGLKGTVVKIEVMRQNYNDPITFEITRDDIVIGAVEYKELDNNIGYIKIDQFDENISKDVKDALKEFDSKNISKIIIDLRGNPGGYLSEAVALGQMFIPKGPIVHVEEKDKPLETFYSNLESPKYKLVVLVDGGSASASEVFAGAVQDTKAGILIGTKTYGKGTVQTVFQMDDGNYIKLTIARYLTPNKRSVDGTGLQPDIVVQDMRNTINENMFEPIKYFRNLVPENKGQDVLAVEQRLQALGYSVDGPDYNYDETTKKGIMQFERDHKLRISAVITKKTMDALDTAIKDEMTKDAQLDKAIEVLK